MRALIGSIRDTLQRAGATDKISERPLYRHGPELAAAAASQQFRKVTPQGAPLSATRLVAIAERSEVLLARHPVELHAFNLLLVLRATHAGREILASEAERVYMALCTENWWLPRRWKDKNGVAHHLRLLNGQDKTYRWFEHDDGSRHRLSVYLISERTPAPSRRQRGRRKGAGGVTPDVTPTRRAVAA
jgi:hypothetical protein